MWKTCTLKTIKYCKEKLNRRKLTDILCTWISRLDILEKWVPPKLINAVSIKIQADFYIEDVNRGLLGDAWHIVGARSMFHPYNWANYIYIFNF